MTTTVNEYVSQVIGQMPRATPMREQIELELRGTIAERMERGQSIDEIVRQLGEPRALADSYLSAVPLVPASFGRRAAARFLDTMVVVIFAGWPVLALRLTQNMTDRFRVLFALCLLVGVLLSLFYIVLAEYWVGTTVGKHLLGLLVVRESGARISFGQSIVRQIPTFAQFFVIDVLFALFTEKHQRAFELVSKTRVVRAPSGRAAA